MPGWVMILIGVVVLYFLSWCVAFGNALLDTDDMEMSEDEGKAYIREKVSEALGGITISIIVGGIFFTAIYFISTGIFATLPY